MDIYFSPRFKRSFKKLPPALRMLSWKKIESFRAIPFHPSLKTHKLTVDPLWAFSLDHKNRIVFQFLKNESVLFINIGDHSVYRKLK